MSRDIFALREQAQSENTRNQIIRKNFTFEPLPDLFALMHKSQCYKCGNILTIEDRDMTCRQCVLARRMA